MKITRLCLASLFLLIPIAAFSQDIPLFTSDFPPEEFSARRAKIYEAIGQTSIALLQGAPAPSGYVRFRQNNEFYYLCGIEVPHAYLLLDGAQRRASLYLPHRNEARERARENCCPPKMPLKSASSPGSMPSMESTCLRNI
ncbi:MAG: aminopeptidase P N-terminal domain-containing protein [Acidobacteria bacterium]|nr:aminopeptidase P N-terminal domain-containing protein [Acidobacteriota bacterium]